VIRTVQQRLAALGYRIGRVDGWLGEDTVKAIRDFEMDKGLVPKGRICASWWRA
jgi:peptidoglycan hydrolase-like protein with peptidoglycan-binding domain